MSDFDYAGWLERVRQVTLSKESQAPQPAFCSDDDLTSAEQVLGRRLPVSIEQFLRQCGSRNGFGISVRDGDKCISGGTEWDISNLARDIAWCRKVAGECRNCGLMDQAEFLDQALPLLAASNGDYIAIDLRESSNNPPVGYFAHASDSWPRLANSLPDFLTEWENIGYIGPEWWMMRPFFNADGFLDANLANAHKLRALMGAEV